MILGPNHWLNESDLKTILPAEIWVIVFTFVFRDKQEDLTNLFTRGDHQCEENILDGYDEDTQPYMQNIVQNNHLIQSHFHRVITFDLKDLDPKYFFYTIGKVSALHKQIELEKDETMLRWLQHRLNMYKKDLFVTHIISYTCVYDLALNVKNPDHLVEAYYEYVWSDKRSDYYRVY